MNTPRKKARTTRAPVLVVHRSKLRTEGQREAFVDRAVDTLMDLLDEYAAKTGIEPLK